QLEELQEQYGEEQISVEQPKIKIIRKKRPTTDNSTSLISSGVEPSSSVLNETPSAQATIAAVNKQKSVAEQSDDANTLTPAPQPAQ
ncbi:type IV pilus biogenesis/stability protein PilW, partial [Pseudoalteromonas piscicida]